MPYVPVGIKETKKKKNIHIYKIYIANKILLRHIWRICYLVTAFCMTDSNFDKSLTRIQTAPKVEFSNFSDIHFVMCVIEIFSVTVNQRI